MQAHRRGVTLFRTPKSSQAPFRGTPHVRPPMRKTSTMHYLHKQAHNYDYTVGASLCAPATREIRTMHTFVWFTNNRTVHRRGVTLCARLRVKPARCPLYQSS